jgi:hypothetical protein
MLGPFYSGKCLRFTSNEKLGEPNGRYGHDAEKKSAYPLQK